MSERAAERPDTRRVLAGLKDFQRLTARYAYERLYDPDGTRTFLVADEVGLGKTLVARGVIAHAIDHLWDNGRPINVVYICSNADIARQNIQRLQIPGCSSHALASRLTLLPLQTTQLARNRINFVAFTPATSFEQSSGGGILLERALLYWLLDRAWGIQDGQAAVEVMRNSAGIASFHWNLNRLDLKGIDPTVRDEFVRALRRERSKSSLRGRFEDLCRAFRHANVPPEDRKARSNWLGELRQRFAQVCLNALKPDLIILDEFQRFRELLAGDGEAGELAHSLFRYKNDVASARVLLLSATPYKMLTLDDEQETHYRDFRLTLKFLNGDVEGDFADLLAQYGAAISALHTPEGLARLRTAKSALETQLRRLITRTERLSVTSDRSGMLDERNTTTELKTVDLTNYLAFQRIADELEQGDMVEYWKSAPYLLNFMEDYRFKQEFEHHGKDSEKTRRLKNLINRHRGAFLDFSRIRSYKHIEPANARLRALAKATVDVGAWRLLWIPAALNYYEPTGPFAEPALKRLTKQLVFSSWHMVPKVVASLLSYYAERQMIRANNRTALNTPEARKRRRGLLRFGESEGRLVGMPLLTLVYPSLVLAREGDPRELAKISAADAAPLSASKVIEVLTGRMREQLRRIRVRRITGGAPDERWYWIAPILMDWIAYPSESAAWWDQPDLADAWAGAETGEEDGWAKHVASAVGVIDHLQHGFGTLGPPPADLAEVLAHAAAASPAVAALRALGRAMVDPRDRHEVPVRNSSARIGHAFLSLFNHPEAREMVRSWRGGEPYWQRVLEYLHAGNVQAMLDEFVHVLRDQTLPHDASNATAAQGLENELISVLRLRTAALRVDDIVAPPFAREVQIDSEPMRVRFAMRFGDERNEDAAAADGQPLETRKDRVRAAFNSPFWPFVLVTTSVGQEGLDFHPYCHAVVHWNLPSNPVDLEQREGRIHRYKGHAVRKNLADSLGREALEGPTSDVWSTAFRMASARRMPYENDLVPYWLCPGNAKIERHVPALPFSRDQDRLHELRHALTVYRMVFGQSRQEDLMQYLLRNVDPADRAALAAEIRIDLSPENHPSPVRSPL